jgi:hypothetical protein
MPRYWGRGLGLGVPVTAPIAGPWGAPGWGGPLSLPWAARGPLWNPYGYRGTISGLGPLAAVPYWL